MNGGQFSSLIDRAGQPVGNAPLGALLSAHALATPDAPALTISDRSWSFAALDARANRRARQLADQAGVGVGDRVMIAMPNRVEFVETAFAIWKLGAVPCPASWRMAADELTQLIALLTPRVVVGTSALPPLDVPLVNVDDTPVESWSDAPLPPRAVVPGKIVNSGGSTGRPKLIVDPEPSAWGPDKEGRSRPARIVLLNPGPLYHSAPFSYVTMSLAQGSHVICLERFDPLEWLRAVERYRPSFAYVVPTMMARIAKLPREVTAAADLSSIVTLLHMAAPCAPEVKRWWISRIGPEKVIEVYGGTERIGATIINGAEWLEHPGSVGRAAPGEQIIILDEEGAQLPPGQVGEIFFRRAVQPGSQYGYIGAATRIRGDLDSFGDLGWLDADGYLHIADRRTDMVVVGGVNVYPAEIEAAIEALPGVLCAAVIGLPDADMGNRLHAIVELAAETEEPADGIAFLAPAMVRLSTIKRPRSVEFTRERVRDDAGKLRRSRLRLERLERG
ncbi:MAG: AMP-binding protein [Sphingomonadaceae bacterium]|nr:AMP-binding protein [Sphingomonadaceae bacterium]